MTMKIVSAVALVALALAAAACGGSSSSGSGGGTTTEAAGSGGGGTSTVSVASAGSVGNVLVDSQGMTLYTPEQEANGMIACTGPCASIWVPLTLPSGTAKPAGSAELSGKLATVQRPDGAEQVTFQGKPLYSFAEDDGPGSAAGNGVKDEFGGQHFTWHAVTPTGIASASGSGTTTGSNGGGGGGGGYGY